MKNYLAYLQHILTNGRKKLDRTGTGTISIFGGQLEFDLDDGFPLPDGREIKIKAILKELRWFLAGETNTKTLGAKIWDLWALKDDVKRFGKETRDESGNTTIEEHIFEAGECGPIYGAMWRRWPNPDGTTTDQIAQLLEFLGSDNAKKRASRRLVISGWNPSFLPVEGRSHEENILDNKQVLPPCHTVFQFIVEPLTREERIALMEKTHGREKVAVAGLRDAMCDGGSDADEFIDKILADHNTPIEMLSLKLYARSQDVPVGSCFNIASYSAFLLLMSHHFNMKPGRYIHSMGDAHIYTNQVEQVKEWISRGETGILPKMTIKTKRESIFDYTADDFELTEYNPKPAIAIPLAV